jgi:hypothetical protein
VNGAASFLAVRFKVPFATDTLLGLSTKQAGPARYPLAAVSCTVHLLVSSAGSSNSSSNVQRHGPPVTPAGPASPGTSGSPPHGPAGGGAVPSVVPSARADGVAVMAVE